MGDLRAKAVKPKLYILGAKAKKAYCMGEQVWSAGNIVTYKVDSGVTYQEEVDSDASCLTPKTFTPAKSGWVFAGWREDATAAGSVLASKVMEDEPITLYAVFEQAVTLTYYNGSAAPTTTARTRYYNNGNVANPTVTLTQAAVSGWAARGWSTDAAGNAGVVYASGVAFALDASLTLYALYYQTITLTLVTPSGTTYPSGTRYYNSAGNIVNPTFAPVVPALSGWTVRGWSTGTAGNAGVTYASGAAFALTTSITLYALYYQTVTLTTVANGATSANSGTRYYNSSGDVINPTFTVANPAKTGATFIGWSADGSTTVVNSNITGLTLDASTTRYAVFKYADVSAPALTGSYNIDTPNWGHETDGVTALIGTVDGNCYAAANLEVTAAMTVGAWWASNYGWVRINDVTLRGYFSTGATDADPEPTPQEQSGYPCSQGAKAVITVNLTAGSNAINLVNIGPVYKSSCYIYSATLIGRTVVG